MEAEFVNAYVQKQKDAIVDLMMRLLMTETKLSVSESSFQTNMQQLQNEVVELKKQLELLDQYKKQVEDLERENLNLRKLSNR